MLFSRWTVRRCSFRCPPAADPGQGLDSVDSLVRILGVAGAIVHLDACVRSSSCSPSKTTVGFQWCVAFVVSFAQFTRKGDRRRSLGGGSEVGGACWGLRRRWIAVLGAIGGRHGAC